MSDTLAVSDDDIVGYVDEEDEAICRACAVRIDAPDDPSTSEVWAPLTRAAARDRLDRCWVCRQEVYA